MKPVMSELRTALVGAILVALGPLSMALYTPAMPTLVGVYRVSEDLVALTVTLYFAGFALAQLVCGPLSDAYGRRRVAVGFFGVYVIGSAIATVAGSIGWLLAARAIQGVGAAAGVAISRAIVRDLFVGQASARIHNLIGLMLGVAPAVAPTLGGVLLVTAGWHSMFVVMLAYGLFVMLLLARVPETLAAPQPALASPRRLLASYATLLASPAYMRPTLVIAFTLGGVYTLASVLPFVMMERVGLAPAEYGLAMLLQTGSFLVSSLLTQRLLRRVDAQRLVPVGLGLVATSAVLLVSSLATLEPSVPTVMLPIAVWSFGIGLLMPGATTAALAPFPSIAGAASALMGFVQVGGGLLGSLAASLLPDATLGMATVLPCMAAGALAAYLGLGRQSARCAARASTAS